MAEIVQQLHLTSSACVCGKTNNLTKSYTVCCSDAMQAQGINSAFIKMSNAKMYIPCDYLV